MPQTLLKPAALSGEAYAKMVLLTIGNGKRFWAVA